jgi:ABC-type phosphate transport system substrate-binding protein
MMHVAAPAAVESKKSMLFFLLSCLFVFIRAVSAASFSSDTASTIEMHGSGTTNPSKYFWKAMDILEERAGTPVRMTYRAVGSGTGQTEFIGDVSDFGSADIPLTAAQYAGFASGTVVQVPFQLGAVSFFHNVAADDLGVGGRLNLSACTLAKIFLRQITTWDDATIVAENPNLSVPAGQPITIIHRSDGSSSTFGITSYLSVACDSVWTGGVTKDATLFPVDATYALPQQGSGNVANAIAANQYSIGYIDAGHGHELGFQEISLTNRNGQKLTSKEADIPKAATEFGALPAIDADWSAVSLINLDGEDVWPITAFTYFYAKTSLTGQVGNLVKSFMLYCLSPEGQAMVPDFLFYALDSATTTSMISQVNSKFSSLTSWTFELASATQATVGMGEYVFSGKRKSYGDYERELLVSQVDVLKSSVANLQSMESIPVHGSGTTNPSKFFWKLMDTLEERSRIHLSMTYRAVGSGTGIKEFVGADNDYESYSHFGSGDIVVPTEDYTELNTRGKGFVTIPFQLGAISFFHNVPGVPDGKALDLKPCVLAKIFTRKIKTWDHADILDSNPGFAPPAGKEITVVRRIYGSSSTSLISQYLYKVCPSDWDIGVGSGNADSSNPTVPTKAPFWPSDTVAAEGSGGVSDTISDTEYSIGYIESGHGQALGLAEVALQNKDGNYLTAADADIGSAVTQIMSSIPNADGDWDNDNLSLLDLPGEKTWPITAFSYMFIRKDLTSLGRSGPAVKAFAEMVLSTEGQAMLPDFGANAVPAAIIAKGVAGLAQLKFAATSTVFVHELSTLAGTGMGTHVLSVKRKRWADVEREQLVADFAKLKADYEATVAALKAEDDKSVTKDELERLAVPALVVAVVAFLMICTSLILGGVSCTRTRRHERFFNEDERLRDKYVSA